MLSEVARILRIDLLVKLVLAVLLGGIIGFEREIAGKPAGLRTNILICVGAALLMHISIRVALTAGTGGDPGRIAAQVVSGVGFIGAGTIMRTTGSVSGLTSAATIWVVAAIGLTVGAGYYLEGAGAGLLVTFVLAGLGKVEHYARRAQRVVSATIRTRAGTPESDITTALSVHGIRVQERRVYDHEQDRTFELRLAGPARQFPIATAALLREEFVQGVHID